MPGKTCFACYPSALVYEKSDGKKPVQQLIWGDWISVSENTSGEYVQVRARGKDGWMRKTDYQEERLLELVFVDIGQGDGCLVVTPDDKHMVIDAGEGDNMARFLKWRYNGYKTQWKFEAGVITHSDTDHFKGFDKILDEPNVGFATMYHNGLIERNADAKADRLGSYEDEGRERFATGLVSTKRELEDLLSDPAFKKGALYTDMLAKGLTGGKFDDIRSICNIDGWLPGYEDGEEPSIRVLGPVRFDKDGVPRLRWFTKDVGKTKNGNSVILKLSYRDVSILLGGDLNVPAEDMLLSFYSGMDCPQADEEGRLSLIEAARKTFACDIAKSCHHGSSDFTTTFLDAVNPVATVISSGDNESYCHPRADALGAIGAHSRGTRPLIFSTELARSANEAVKHPHILRAQIGELNKQIQDAPTGTTAQRRKRDSLIKKRDKLQDETLTRSIAVFGAINVRTDGRKIVIAQKNEQASKISSKWQIYKLEKTGSGPFVYVD